MNRVDYRDNKRDVVVCAANHKDRPVDIYATDAETRVVRKRDRRDLPLNESHHTHTPYESFFFLSRRRERGSIKKNETGSWIVSTEW